MELFKFSLVALICWANLAFISSKDLPLPNYITDQEFEAVSSLEETKTPRPMRIHNGSEFLPDTIEVGGIGINNFYRHSTWPNARVPYTLNPNVGQSEREQIALAMQEYHSRTCLRFVPKQPSDNDYMEIISDEGTQCGVANLCRIGGRQEAKFGPMCRDAKTYAHEFGHTICMSHEQGRFDRDDYIRFQGCSGDGQNGKTSPEEFTQPSLYDYYSMMHYDGCHQGACIQPKVPLPIEYCGSTIKMSVLDVEKINARYNCGGCLSYRWKSFDQISPADNLELAGNAGAGHPLYICRFMVGAEVVVGKASVLMKSCWVPHEGREIGSGGSQKFEVLTNPERRQFSWSRISKGGALPSGAIAGGRGTAKFDYWSQPEAYYIGRCEYGGQVIPGAVHGNSRTMFVPYGGAAVECNSFEVLTCN